MILYKPKVKIDCDNVLNDMAETMVRMYNSESLTVLDYNKCTEYDFECYGKYFQQWAWSVWNERPRELWSQMRPPTKAEAGLRKFCDNFDVVITTATFPWTFDLTCKYIEKYFSWFPQDKIIRSVDKKWVTTDYAIEDLPKNLLLDVQATRILVDAPWNREFEEEWHDCFRVLDLVEAYDLITDFERNNDLNGGDEFDE